MKTIPIAEIKVNTDRFRSDVGNLKELASSLEKYGQLQPIIIDQDNNLIAGFRRLSAAKMNDWEEIGFERFEDMSEVRRREIELEENIRRLQMDWQDQAKAIKEIHAMKLAEDDEWTQTKTAELLGITQSHLNANLQLVDHLDEPEIAQANTLRGAKSRLKSLKQLKHREAVARASGDRSRFTIMTGDASEEIKHIPDESIDCIITNPPFGVDLDFKGTKPYEDEEDAIMYLMQEIVPEMFRVLKPESWLCCFFDIVKMFPYPPGGATVLDEVPFEEYRPGLVDILAEAGFLVNRIPCMWVKPNKTQGVLHDPNTTLVVAYEAFLLARKGGSVLTRKGRQNIFIFDTPDAADRIFSVQMPVDLCVELVEMLTVGGELILDPFCGSGSIGEGALLTQRNFVGIELNEDRAKRAEARLSNVTPH